MRGGFHVNDIKRYIYFHVNDMTRYIYIVARQILNITMQNYNITRQFTRDIGFCISFHPVAFSVNQEPILDWILT